jgi:hypothetical protein
MGRRFAGHGLLPPTGDPGPSPEGRSAVLAAAMVDAALGRAGWSRPAGIGGDAAIGWFGIGGDAGTAGALELPAAFGAASARPPLRSVPGWTVRAPMAEGSEGSGGSDPSDGSGAPKGSGDPEAPKGSGDPEAPEGSGDPEAPEGIGDPSAPEGSDAPKAPVGSGGSKPPKPPKPPEGSGDGGGFRRTRRIRKLPRSRIELWDRLVRSAIRAALRRAGWLPPAEPPPDGGGGLLFRPSGRSGDRAVSRAAWSLLSSSRRRRSARMLWAVRCLERAGWIKAPQGAGPPAGGRRLLGRHPAKGRGAPD